jgi:hypothetical protein
MSFTAPKLLQVMAMKLRRHLSERLRFASLVSALRGYVLSTVRVHGSALLSFVGATLAVIGFLASEIFISSAHIYWKSAEALGVFCATVGALISSVQQTRGSEELNNTNLEIISLQRQVSDTLTGGSSFCYLMLMPDWDDGNYRNSGAERLCVMPPRDNPLYDVRVQYRDTATALQYGAGYAESLLRLVKGGGSFNAVGTAEYDQFHQLGTILTTGSFKLRAVTISNLPFVIDARFVLVTASGIKASC